MSFGHCLSEELTVLLSTTVGVLCFYCALDSRRHKVTVYVNYGELLFYFLLSSTSIKSCFTNCIVSVIMIWKYRVKCKNISNFFAYHLLISCIMLPKLACMLLSHFFFLTLFCLVTQLFFLLSVFRTSETQGWKAGKAVHRQRSIASYKSLKNSHFA